MPPRRASSPADARRKVDRLRALRGDPQRLREFAGEILADEASPELVKLALLSLGENVRPADGPLIRDVYAYFDANGPKRDPTGPVRVEALRALWHLRSRDDLELARQASRRVEPGMNSNGEVIRAAGLALLGVLDPDAAAYAASWVLASRDAAEFSGEPALTAVRLLANLGELRLLLAFAVDPGAGMNGEVRAEAIRSLGPVPMEYLGPLFESLAVDEDEAVAVGLADLVIQLEPTGEVLKLVRTLLHDAPQPELYEFLVTSLVASRKNEFVAVLLETLPTEMSQKRLRAARDALALALPTPEVRAAITSLEERLARRSSPR